MPKYSLRTLLIVITMVSVCIPLIIAMRPNPTPEFHVDGYLLRTPPVSVFWCMNGKEEIINGIAVFGESRPKIVVSHQTSKITISNGTEIEIPMDGSLYILDPEIKIHKSNANFKDIRKGPANVAKWTESIRGDIIKYSWTDTK